MAEPARRIALIASPGAASLRIREALVAAGGDLVLEAAADADAARVRELAPDVVVVVLDAATEAALDRLDPLLADPGIRVLYEEAELAVAREGWDAARWQRHLNAKLHGHADVLPPMPDDAAPVAAPASEREPSHDGLSFAPADLAAPHDPPSAFDAGERVVDGLPLDGPAFDPDPAADIAFEPTVVETIAFDATAFEATASEPTAFETTAFDATAFDPAMDVEPAPVDARPRDIAPVAGLDEFLASSAQADAPPDVAPPAVAPPTAAPVAGPPPLPRVTADAMTLADDTPALRMDDAATGARFHDDLADLERRIAGMTLVDDRLPAPGPSGAVVVLAGIGGPDAVRQLLAALPAEFPRPVLVRQRLDGGRYDKLVAQMQRVTALPVRLAEPGHVAVPGEIYIVPPEVGAHPHPQGVRFDDLGGDLFSALPADDSALLLLSGSDPQVVDRALSGAWSGALVAGQSPEGCFDPGAANELIARGGETGQPQELAARLTARWPSAHRARFGDPA